MMTAPVYKKAFGYVPPIPVGVREAVMARAHGVCEDCGSRGTLELHHLRYSTVLYPGEPEGLIFGHETVDDLGALCRECHHRRHIGPFGDFWVDPEEMKDFYAPHFEWSDFGGWEMNDG